MASRRLFEGPNIEKLLARIQSELGPAAQVVSAEKVRRGGMGGFFARETYQVIVESPDDERPARPSIWGGRRRSAAPAGTPVPVAVDLTVPGVAVPSTEGAPFAELLRRLTENAGPAGPATEPIPAAATRPEPVISTPASPAPAVSAPAASSIEAVVDEDLSSVLGADQEWQSAETWLSDAEGQGGADRQPAVGEQQAADPAAGAGVLAAAPVAPVDQPAVTDEESGPAPAPASRNLQPVPLPGSELKAGLAGITPARARPALKKMGVPTALLPADGRLGLVPALYRSLSKMPAAPAVRLQPGEVMAVVGDADRALELASRLALSIGLDPGDVVMACPGEGAPAEPTLRQVISSGEAAETAAEEWADLARPTVVSIAAAPGSGREAWAGNVIGALQPAAVWGVVEATRKPEDISAWSRAVGQVDALALEDLDATTSPAAVLGTGIPVALLDGQLASAEAWTALLAARLRAAA